MDVDKVEISSGTKLDVDCLRGFWDRMVAREGDTLRSYLMYPRRIEPDAHILQM